jgi:GNAT superfamily N-acetyltransferase
MNVFRAEKGYGQLRTIARWLHDEWGHYHPDRIIEGDIDHLDNVASGKLIPSLYVTELGDVAVGTASIVECDLPLRSQYTPWLASVYVPSSHRRRGIASELVRYVEKVAASNGIEQLFLFTPDAQALYRSLGWQALEELDYRGETITIMARQLSADQKEASSS